jgi:hypothetical protein
MRLRTGPLTGYLFRPRRAFEEKRKFPRTAIHFGYLSKESSSVRTVLGRIDPRFSRSNGQFRFASPPRLERLRLSTQTSTHKYSFPSQCMPGKVHVLSAFSPWTVLSANQRRRSCQNEYTAGRRTSNLLTPGVICNFRSYGRG